MRFSNCALFTANGLSGAIHSIQVPLSIVHQYAHISHCDSKKEPLSRKKQTSWSRRAVKFSERNVGIDLARLVTFIETSNAMRRV
jgi:hypothetical protein